MPEEKKEEKKIKSVIIDAELKEWEDWGNKWFGHDQPTDDLYHKEDFKKRK
jgi:hypothetical protein